MLPSNKETPEQPGVIFEPPAEYGDIQPRFAQIEALEELNKTLEEEYNKALVVMATGLGKTYLAGFFSMNFKRYSLLPIGKRFSIKQESHLKKSCQINNMAFITGKRKKEMRMHLCFYLYVKYENSFRAIST